MSFSQKISKLKLACRYPGIAAERARARAVPRIKIASLIKKGGLLAPPPIAVSISLTHLCNLKCSMCGQWRRKGDLPGEMLPLAKLNEIISSISPFKPKIYVWGGEPLLYPQVAELINFIKKRKQLLVINTNGVLLEKFASKIVETDVDGLDISINGNAEINDRICGVPGSFDRVMAGVTLLKKFQKKMKKRKPMLKVICTISKLNQDFLEESLKTISESKLFDAIIFNLG